VAKRSNQQNRSSANDPGEPAAATKTPSGASRPETAPHPLAPPQREREWLWSILLVAAVFLVYQPVWRAGFIWDDDYHLTANPCIIGPLGLKEIWTTSAAMYYPLVLTTFWVEHALWGLDPLGYHLVNILLHGAGAILLWRVLRRLAVPGAWLGAALWALHPVQVESVAWITETKNTQSGMFYLLAILFFLKWHDAPPAAKRPPLLYALALACATLAMLSKSSTVMLPVVLGLCAWWHHERWSWRAVAWLAPFFLISAVVGAWTIWEQMYHSGAQGAEWAQSWPERIVIAGCDVWFYLGKLAWPHPLIFIYPRWDFQSPRLVDYLPALAVAGTLFYLWRGRHGPLRPVLFAAAYFVILLFPVLGFFNVYFFRYSYVGDHFQYLASMGPLALAGAGIATALGSRKNARSLLPPALGATLLLFLGLLTWRQSPAYADITTLWQTTIARNPDCWMAMDNLGLVLEQTGKVPEAIAQFRQALRIKPDFADAHNDLGQALIQAGQLAEAVGRLKEAVRIDPDYVLAHNNLAVALVKSGQTTEAMEQFKQTFRINPNDAEAHNNLGSVLFQSGQFPQAIAQYQQALQIDPDYALARCNLASALLQSGRIPEAIAQYRQALLLNPDFADAHKDLGQALSQAGQTTEAIAQYRQALLLDPDFADAHKDFGQTLSQAGQLADAAEQFKQTLRINPNDAEAHNNLGSVLFQSGQFPQAIAQYQQALQIEPDYAVARCNLASALLQSGRIPEAIEQYRQTLRIAPDFSQAHSDLGLALKQTGRFTEAMEQFNQVLRLNPQDTTARDNLDRLQILQKTAPAN